MLSGKSRGVTLALDADACSMARVVAVAAALLFSLGTSARAQVVITAGEDVKFQLGVLAQFWADAIDSAGTDEATRNLFIRRVRLLFAGQVAEHVKFFIETDAPNLGRVLPGGKNITPSVIVQDAYGEFSAGNKFMVNAGLMYVPFSRNSLQSAASLLPIDYGPYTFVQSGPTQSSTGRDTGFQARGYLLRQRLEYRIGAFQGVRNARSTNELRYVGRAQFNLFDSETAFFYPGTYLGKKRVVAVAAAFDSQSAYHAYDADAFVDVPLLGGAITAQVDYNHFDGSTTLVGLPRQHVELVEVGYLISPVRLTPFFQFTNRDIADARTGDDRRWSVGLGFWWVGHNANIKGAYTRIAPRGGARENEFTIQLQVFYF
jgi:hypothetical protein